MSIYKTFSKIAFNTQKIKHLTVQITTAGGEYLGPQFLFLFFFRFGEVYTVLVNLGMYYSPLLSLLSSYYLLLFLLGNIINNKRVYTHTQSFETHRHKENENNETSSYSAYKCAYIKSIKGDGGYQLTILS